MQYYCQMKFNMTIKTIQSRKITEINGKKILKGGLMEKISLPLLLDYIYAWNNRYFWNHHPLENFDYTRRENMWI